MLCSSSVKEAGDLATVSHAATLEARLPFLHFFTPQLHLSTSAELRLPLHWIGVLGGTTTCSLAASTGADALRLLLASADVVMTTSAVRDRGPEYLAAMEAEMRTWMNGRDYDSVEQLKGNVSRRNVPDPQAYQRANYYQALHSWKRTDH
jgi:dihydroorotate dehydrogenase (fumarate)